MPKLIDFSEIITNIPALLKYLPITICIVFFSMLIGLILGLIIAIVIMKKIPILYQISYVFVSFIRGTPLLVQLYLSFYGIPVALKYWNYYNNTNFNINNISAIVFVLVAFSLNEAAYNSENIRGALLSVDKGEVEAALSLGMTNIQTLKRIELPEALIVAIPTIGNQLISLLKGTSLAFVAGVIEMTAEGQIIGGRTFRYFEVYLSLAIIYWILTILIQFFTMFLEKRVNKFKKVQNLIKYKSK
jgi:polar amino acid transport system permease protein